jgi:AcrR family transcriptional regulator
MAILRLSILTRTVHDVRAVRFPRPDSGRYNRNRMVATAQSKIDKPSRLSAEDWAVAALDVIAETGLASVAVEPLAKRLGVTKGSFYWHFPSREALLIAALERWEKTEQETVPTGRARAQATHYL